MSKKKVQKISATILRLELADTLNEIAYNHVRYIIERSGKEIAAIVPMEDFERLQREGADEETSDGGGKTRKPGGS